MIYKFARRRVAKAFRNRSLIINSESAAVKSRAAHNVDAYDISRARKFQCARSDMHFNIIRAGNPAVVCQIRIEI